MVSPFGAGKHGGGWSQRSHISNERKWQATRNKDVKGTSETKQSKAFEDSLECDGLDGPQSH